MKKLHFGLLGALMCAFIFTCCHSGEQDHQPPVYTPGTKAKPPVAQNSYATMKQGLSTLPHAPWASSLGTKTPTQCFNGSFSHSPPLQYGIDYIMPIGTSVLAVAPGTVEYIYDGCGNNTSSCSTSGAATCNCFHGIGNVVVLGHGGGLYSLYAHLNRGTIRVAVGQTVCTGMKLADSGWSGFGTAPHLHFQFQNTAGGDTQLVNGYVSVSFNGWYGLNGTTQTACDALTSYNTEMQSCHQSINVNQTYTEAVSKDQSKLYKFDKLAGRQYTVTLHPTNGGDPDLYGSYDPAFDKSNAQFKSIKGAGIDDIITFSSTQTGPYFLLVYGYAASNCTIRVTETTTSSQQTITVNTTTSGAVAGQAQMIYQFQRVQGKTYEIILHPTNGGDPDLYTSKDASISRTNYQCKSTLGAGRDDTCSFTATDSGINYILVYGYSASNYTLSVQEKGSGSTSCTYQCSDYGFSRGQCYNNWKCDCNTGCLSQGCTTSTSCSGGSTSCTYRCSDYGFAPGQCYSNWKCDCSTGCLSQGCITSTSCL